MSHTPSADPSAEFATGKVSSVVIKNALPAMIAMIMVMVYNLADTFFISLTHDDYQIAAVSLGAPVFMILMSLGTLFGVGGTSVISRALGSNDTERAKKACSFCTWASVVIGVVLMALLWLFADRFCVLLGANDMTLGYTKTYLVIVTGCGVFSMLSNCHSNIVRAEGKAMMAMTGSLIGNLLNVILDPIFILGFKWGIAGAAVATVIGNAASALYYIVYFLRKKTRLSMKLRDFSMKGGIFKDVVSVGISASLANLLVSVSSMVANKLLAGYGDLYVASYGVTAKILLLVTMLGIGIGAGVQPVIGYCYGAKNRERTNQFIRFSIFFATVVCLAVSVLCFIFARPVVGVFLTDATAMESSISFTRIMLLTAWLIGAFVVSQNALQAMGAATPALLASILRQAVLFIPIVFILRSFMGMDGIIWAQPAADVISLVIIIIMLLKKLRER